MKLINYPAMASPQAVKCINDALIQHLRKDSTILDPYCGTGRLLIQPRIQGQRVTGVDCSPIAILAARVTHRGIPSGLTENIFNRTAALANELDSSNEPTKNILFWFPKQTIGDLRSLLQAIDILDISIHLRRLLWLCLADTCRKVSYARDKEFKLHRIKPHQRSHWRPNTLAIFQSIGTTIRDRLYKLHDRPIGGHYRFYEGDIVQLKTIVKDQKYDAIISSPPYGDSRTTVGYGQFARLPLMVLCESTLFNREYNRSTIRISLDTICLGGSHCPSTTSSLLFEDVEKIDNQAMKRFGNDYFGRLELLFRALKKNGIISLILGDRTCSGCSYPLIDSTINFLRANRFKQILRQDRLLSWKHLPRTMRHKVTNGNMKYQSLNYETILCFKK